MSSKIDAKGKLERRAKDVARLDEVIATGALADLEGVLLNDQQSIAREVGALAEACRVGHVGAARVLLRNGYLVGGETFHEDFEPPIVWALASGSEELVALLCEAGAVDRLALEWIEPCSDAVIDSRRSWQGNPALPFLRALDLRCTREPELRFSGTGVSGVIKACKSLTKSEPAQSETRQLLRRLEKRVDRVESLVNEAVERPESVESLKRRILALPDEARQSAMSLLLPLLAVYGLRFEHTEFGRSVLHDGFDPGNPDITRYMKNRHQLLQWLLDFDFDVNATDAMGRTALIYSAWNGEMELWKWLVARGADPTIASIERSKARSLVEWAELGLSHSTFVPLCEEYLRHWSSKNEKEAE